MGTKQFGVDYAAATTPLDGTETLSIVQDGVTVDATTQDIADLGGGMANPMTTAGDIIKGGESGTPERLAIGTAGQVLTVSGGAPAWAAATGVSDGDKGDITVSSSGTVWTIDADVVRTIRSVPQNSQSAAYTTVLTDAGGHIFHPSADTTARTWTIDSNANVPYAIGTAITFINQNSAGVITIAITSDTMRLAGAGTTGNRTLAANGIATAIKVTSTEWIISGTGLT